ncbi:hypothetical protein MIND_01422400 [Mycena indigotica]|uniref:Uncharacterized protein n=1 Tax=Mycena indigotica TaxID=2126181 RepID=A0A8H6VSU1_9AGAR|nr:uncharacterized protein MIND_01422400 [Mycena indigotica]KAF7288768.1 hypothetical protein MIND_01422400 [Mycena indigotica]
MIPPASHSSSPPTSMSGARPSPPSIQAAHAMSANGATIAMKSSTLALPCSNSKALITTTRTGGRRTGMHIGSRLLGLTSQSLREGSGAVFPLNMPRISLAVERRERQLSEPIFTTYLPLIHEILNFSPPLMPYRPLGTCFISTALELARRRGRALWLASKHRHIARAGQTTQASSPVSVQEIRDAQPKYNERSYCCSTTPPRLKLQRRQHTPQSNIIVTPSFTTSSPFPRRSLHHPHDRLEILSGFGKSRAPRRPQRVRHISSSTAAIALASVYPCIPCYSTSTQFFQLRHSRGKTAVERVFSCGRMRGVDDVSASKGYICD